MSSDTRLIERWLPIAALGEESVRERRSMTALPPTYYLHVWWARRPLVASRAAVLACLLPGDADRDRFMNAVGIHGDPVASRRRIDMARRKGIRFEGDAYDYARAFTYRLDDADLRWLAAGGRSAARVLDPTAGGGSIPFESIRTGLETFANELNPVAGVILRATLEYPVRYGLPLVKEYKALASEFVRIREERLSRFFPPEDQPNCVLTNLLWTRTVTCPYCDGIVPLSPNWRLTKGGVGVHMTPHMAEGPATPGRHCTFQIVSKLKDQSPGTVSGGDATCPFEDCRRVIQSEEIKAQAQAGRMGEQLYAVVYKRLIPSKNRKSTKPKGVREFRAPRPEDSAPEETTAYLAERLPEWEALDLIPTESFPADANDDRPIQYGMPRWRDLFSPRQLLCQCTHVEIFRELLDSRRSKAALDDISTAAFVYLAFAIDKLADYNSRMTRWHAKREVVANTFDRHDFSFKWSYVEMPMIVGELKEDWAIKQIGKCIAELVYLTRGEKLGKGESEAQSFSFENTFSPPSITITCKSADSMDHISDESIDVVVMDPPYYNNVTYAELADFFYIWEKRTIGYLIPELYRTPLTDKDHEAIANPARFKGQKGAAALANRDYRERMASIFAECRRVLKPDGIMTLMFTHKATGAWDALTKGLMQARFTITASWPINTEAEGGLHIKDKAAANSTIFLVCRPLAMQASNAPASYWEEVEPQVADAVRERIREFQDAGIGGVDLYLASFGPALQKFSGHWPYVAVHHARSPRSASAASRQRCSKKSGIRTR